MKNMNASIIRRRSFTMLMAFCVSCFTSGVKPLTAEDAFEPLLKKIPGSANALMLVDADAVFSSPLAIKSGWNLGQGKRPHAQPLILPPEASHLVIASQMNPNQGFQQAYELAVVRLAEPLTMRSIARAEGGYVDLIGAVQAAWSPTDSYFVQNGSDTIGLMFPANRQAAGRWAEFGLNNQKLEISPYLQGARLLVGKQTQIVMAFDLENSVQPHELRKSLTESPLVGEDAEKRQRFEQALFGLKGVTLGVSLTDSAQGTLLVDFSTPPNALGQDAKPLVLAALEKFGVYVDDIQNWTATYRSDAIELSGPLSEAGMRRIFSLLEMPSSNFSRLKEENPEEESQPDKIAQASLLYFQAIATLLDDMQHEFKTNRDARQSYAPVYMDRYARKIDRFPILNVDEELLAYGSSVAETLRRNSVTTKTAAVNQGVQKSAVYGNYEYVYDQNGYVSRVNSAATKQNIKTQIERQQEGEARKVRFESWKDIEDATASMRVRMTQKYQLEF